MHSPSVYKRSKIQFRATSLAWYKNISHNSMSDASMSCSWLKSSNKSSYNSHIGHSMSSKCCNSTDNSCSSSNNPHCSNSTDMKSSNSSMELE